jgi:hypothetical protein
MLAGLELSPPMVLSNLAANATATGFSGRKGASCAIDASDVLANDSAVSRNLHCEAISTLDRAAIQAASSVPLPVDV